jgi:L-alanine-DL-glutamate epimerase-like enolase superfamily enzyme
MTQPHKTASGTVSESPLVLTDVVTDDGTVGHSIIFTYAVAGLKPTADLIKNLEPFVKGEPLTPIEIADRFAKHFRLLGMQGLVAMAVAGIDMALWDALSRSHNRPILARAVRTAGSREQRSSYILANWLAAWACPSDTGITFRYRTFSLLRLRSAE